MTTRTHIGRSTHRQRHARSVFTRRPGLTPGDIIEAIIDELAMGELGQSVDAIVIDRTGPGSLHVDYGEAGRFRLEVVPLDG